MNNCNSTSLKRRAHIRYFIQHLAGLPRVYSNLDSTRLVLTFFAISGLDVLNSLSSISDERTKEIIDWIYSLQVDNEDGNLPCVTHKPNMSSAHLICLMHLVSGFQGTSIFNTIENKGENSSYKWGHIANTYSALCSLLALGDDLSRINRTSIIKSLRALQDEEGCYSAAKEGTESDMRFVYCAACVCYILDDWRGMDIEKTIQFIHRSISYDFGIGQGPELECHGGPTFCAIATLVLLKRLDTLSDVQVAGIIRWLVFRQVDGFQGRPNKPVDTCYSFWIGATLKMLGVANLVNVEKNYEHVMSTEDHVIGGFSKWVDTHPDPLHTYLGLASLSLMRKEGLSALIPTLNISEKAFENLMSVHEKWRNI